MAPVNKVKDLLENGGVAFGTWLQMASPTVANVLARSGMDFVTVDMEHGPHSFSEAESILYAIEAGDSTPMIRLGEASEPTILRACDIGCQGILTAHCRSAEEAANVVAAMRFHPAGVRGMAPFTKLHDWSSEHLSEKLSEANSQQLAGVLIEDRNGLANSAEIVEVEGLDIIYVGIYDLSQMLGLAGQLDHPEVLETVTDLATRINHAGKVAGAVCRDAEHMRWLLDTGFRYLSYLCDTALLGSAARAARSEFDACHA